MSTPPITASVLSKLTAGLLQEAILDHNRGDIATGIFLVLKRELEDIDGLKRRRRIPEDFEEFRAWAERRHRSLPTTRETRAVERMIRRLVSNASIYVAAYESGRQDERGEARPKPLAAEIDAERTRGPTKKRPHVTLPQIDGSDYSAVAIASAGDFHLVKTRDGDFSLVGTDGYLFRPVSSKEIGLSFIRGARTAGTIRRILGPSSREQSRAVRAAHRFIRILETRTDGTPARQLRKRA